MGNGMIEPQGEGTYNYKCDKPECVFCKIMFPVSEIELKGEQQRYYSRKCTWGITEVKYPKRKPKQFKPMGFKDIIKVDY